MNTTIAPPKEKIRTTRKTGIPDRNPNPRTIPKPKA